MESSNAAKEGMRHARKVICISGKVRQLLIDGMGAEANAEVVYNGTDSDLFSPASTSDRTPTILIVGNLLAGKGHELVLRAICRVKDSRPGLQCRIIGEGAHRDRFANLARDLGISDHTLQSWKKQLQQTPENAFPGNGNPRDPETAALQRELRRLKEENEILKKAVGIFTKLPR